jgi:hypothetical protein
MMQVVRNDPCGYVLGWLLGFVMVMPMAIFLFSTFDGTHPTESWSEILGGVTLLVLLGAALVRLRTNVLERRLTTLPRVTAELLRYIQTSQWMNFRVRYRWEDRTLERSVMVPNGKYSARLMGRETLTLAVEPTNPKRVTIVDLYVSPDGP